MGTCPYIWSIVHKVNARVHTFLESMDKFISAREAASKWGVSNSAVSVWCREGRVPGAIQVTSQWLIPSDLRLEDVKRPKMGRPTTEQEKTR